MKRNMAVFEQSQELVSFLNTVKTVNIFKFFTQASLSLSLSLKDLLAQLVDTFHVSSIMFGIVC